MTLAMLCALLPGVPAAAAGITPCDTWDGISPAEYVFPGAGTADDPYLIDSAAALAYLTGEEDFYWYNDDGQNADVLAEQLMQAPGFSEIAGAVNLYRDERILDEGAYLRFLIDVADSQTISVLYG